MRLAVRGMFALVGCAAGCGSLAVNSGSRLPQATPERNAASPAPSRSAITSAQSESGDDSQAAIERDRPRRTADRPGLYHQVKAGETLSGIASLYGVTVVQIVQGNRLDAGSKVVPGESLYIPREK